MNEVIGGRLELTGMRALALLGRRLTVAGSALESAGDATGPPRDNDVALLAQRIAQHAGVGTVVAAGATKIAADIVALAAAAVNKLESSTNDGSLTDEECVALESVIHVRGRPAVRVLGARLESLDKHPGSDLWQLYISDYENAMIAAASATGAVNVTAPETLNRPWLQGSAWLVARDRVVTNRHVLLPPPGGVAIVESAATPQIRAGVSVAIDFTADDRTPAAGTLRKVLGVKYVAPPGDPFDIAVLTIEPIDERQPLRLLAENAEGPRNLFVVGHPALTTEVAKEVAAVFGNPDGRKRVSFGRRQPAGGHLGRLGHDASTVGGYSGGPVVGIKGDAVAGLHYYGDPVNGNLAVTAAALRQHVSFAFLDR